MLMTNANVRLFPHDRLLARTILRLVPRWLLPNHFTILRFLLIPLVLALLWQKQWEWMLAVFFFAGLTDAIDGSLARTRKQITMWGTVADPVADKLLVGLVVLFYVMTQVSLWIGLAIIGLELLIVGGAVLRRKKIGYMTANVFGKMKMFLQIAGVSLLILAQVLQAPLVIPLAIGVLVSSVAVGVVSFATYSF
jgi:CDP-diacylglycerol---glycerol-3-phosphate 3-phosphatidyltransferase